MQYLVIFAPKKLHEMINSFPLIKANYADPQIVPLQQHAAFMPPGSVKKDS